MLQYARSIKLMLVCTAIVSLLVLLVYNFAL